MREGLQQDLRTRTASVAEMCGQAGLAMERATGALLRADLELAEQVITGLQEIAPKVGGTEDDAFKLLALQAPVAGDLRAVRQLAPERRRCSTDARARPACRQDGEATPPGPRCARGCQRLLRRDGAHRGRHR